MSRVICVTGWFDESEYRECPTGKKEFLVSHGVDENTGKTVILPCEHPRNLGAVFDRELQEWVLEDA